MIELNQKHFISNNHHEGRYLFIFIKQYLPALYTDILRLTSVKIIIIFTLKLKSKGFLIIIGFVGISASPSTIFTKQYSIKAINTNLEHININRLD